MSHENEDRLIVRAWKHGAGIEALAENFGVSPKHVKELVDKERQHRILELKSSSPEQLLAEHLLHIEALQEGLASVARQEQGAVRLGALVAQGRAEIHRFEVMRLVGLLPRDMGRLGREIDYEKTVMRVIEILEDHDLLTPEVTEKLSNAHSWEPSPWADDYPAGAIEREHRWSLRRAERSRIEKRERKDAAEEGTDE